MVVFITVGSHGIQTVAIQHYPYISDLLFANRTNYIVFLKPDNIVLNLNLRI